MVKKDAASQCSDTDQEQNKVWLNKRDNYDFKQDGDFFVPGAGICHFKGKTIDLFQEKQKIIPMTAKKMEQSAHRKIRQLRKKRLEQGQPFMISSDQLPSWQCYLEYPDGSIKIAEAGSKNADFKIIGELDYFNAQLLRWNLKLT